MMVIDSSAIVTVFYKERYSEKVRKHLINEDKVLTLDLAFYEVTNVIRKKVLEEEMKIEEAKRVFNEFKELLSAFEVHSFN